MAEHSIDIDEIIRQLLKRLGSKGFSIGNDSYIKTTQVFHWFLLEKKGEQLANFARYLAPVICKNDSEQAQFKAIFNEFFLARFANFEKQVLVEEAKRIDEIREIEQKRKRKRNKIILLCTLPLVVIALVTALIWYITHPTHPSTLVNISKTKYEPFFVFKNSDNILDHEDQFKEPEDSSKFNVTYKFHRSGKIKKGVTVTHRFDTYGKDTIAVRLVSNTPGVDTTLFYPEVYVGPEDNLAILPEKETVIKNGSNTFTASIDTTIITGIYWEVNNNKDTVITRLNGNPITYVFKDTGEYNVVVKYDTERDSFLQKFPPGFVSALYTQKVAMPGLQLSINSRPPGMTSTESVNRLWIVVLLLLALCLLCAALMAWLQWIKKQRNTRPAQDNFKGNKPPYNLQLLSRDKEIRDTYAILRLAADLSKRIESANASLDIAKTINQTITNRGFVTPGFARKKINREYLFLIDQAYTNDQQVNLFTYLAKHLISRSVKLDYYYYNQTPDKFYKDIDGSKISIENLKDRYYNSALIVFADGYNFIEWKSQEIKETVNGALGYWPNRVLVTPVNFDDWAGNEKTLATFFNVIPADIVGLMELVRAIETDTGEQNFTGKFNSYEAKYADFGSIDGLKEYLAEQDGEDGDLFQWICALAIHAKLYWELTIAIGRSVVTDPSKINYDTLLKLARIQWIREGSFPASVRLALLKKLSKVNEKLARVTLLKMLDEIPESDDIFSYEEKQLSRYASSFALVSSKDPKYISDERLAAGEQKFLWRYKNRLLNDNPLKVYLEKKESPGDTWNTLTTAGNGNTGIEDYIKEKDEAAVAASENEHRLYKKKMKRYLGGAAISLLMLGALFFGKNQLYSINKYFHFIDITMVKENTTQVYFTSTECFKKLVAQAKDTLATLEISKGGTVLSTATIRLRDSFYYIEPLTGLQYDSTKSLDYKLTVNGQLIKNTIPLIPGTYDISLTGCVHDTLGTVTYYRGSNEDTSVVFNAFKGRPYKMNVIRPRSYYNPDIKTDQANAIIFDSAISRQEMFDISVKLLAEGFPLKHIGIDPSHGSLQNIIIIKASAKLTSKENLSLDSIKCMLLNDGCPPSSGQRKSVIQILYSNNHDVIEFSQLFSCIDSRQKFVTYIKSSGPPAKSYYRLHYFRDSFKDSAKILLNCLKASFPGKNFSSEKKASSLSNANIAAKIYFIDSAYVLPPEPQIIINISDERLRPGGANQVRNDLLKEGLSVQPIKVNNVSSNLITYSDNSLRTTAELIKTVYEKYFAASAIDIKYLSAQAQQRLLTLSIKENRRPLSPFTFSDINFANEITSNDKFIVGFNIGYTGNQNAAAVTYKGRICIFENPAGQVLPKDIVCVSFDFSDRGIAKVSKAIDVTNIPPGQYGVRATVEETEGNIGTTKILGFVTIKAASNPCDTIHSYVGLGTDGIIFKAKRYVSVPLKQRGFTFSLIERNPKYAVFTLKQDKCKTDTLSFWIGETKTVNICDGSRIILTMLEWENKEGNAWNKEAIFDAIICPVK